MINLTVECDDDDCVESEYIDVNLPDQNINLVSLKDYLSDCMGWSFGEYKDEGNNPQVLCETCTAKREEISNVTPQVQS